MHIQMIGRAGRPQYDTEGVAVIMTQTDVSEGSSKLNGILRKRLLRKAKFVKSYYAYRYPFVQIHKTYQECAFHGLNSLLLVGIMILLNDLLLKRFQTKGFGKS